MGYLELEEIIYNLERDVNTEKGLKNKYLYNKAIKALRELKDRKNKM